MVKVSIGGVYPAVHPGARDICRKGEERHGFVTLPHLRVRKWKRVSALSSPTCRPVTKAAGHGEKNG